MGVVSYATRIMEVLQAQKLEIPSLKIGMFGAETFSDSMREKIENGLGIEAFDIYGMTETGGVSTTGMDCQQHCGIHVWEDQYIVEVVDPKTGEPVEDGKTGEIVFTSLTREAMPVIRFKTGDFTRVLTRKPCACGRTCLRIDRVTGRVDDMLIIKGVNFFPRQIEQALMEIPGVLAHYQMITRGFGVCLTRPAPIRCRGLDGKTQSFSKTIHIFGGCCGQVHGTVEQAGNAAHGREHRHIGAGNHQLHALLVVGPKLHQVFLHDRIQAIRIIRGAFTTPGFVSRTAFADSKPAPRERQCKNMRAVRRRKINRVKARLYARITL